MTSFDIETMTGGIREIRDKLDKLKMIPQQVRKVKDDDLITTLELALEMCVRGLNIYGVNLYKSDAHDFVVSDDRSGLYMPFCAIDGMGDSAGESIIAARNEKPFTTKKDFAERTSVNKTVRDTMERLGIFKELQDDDQLTLDLGI
jgi:DNA polymerase-3 subunit alpha (Gram-positive type)